MKTAILATVLLITLLPRAYGQSGSINNTLGTDGQFTIMENSQTLFLLNRLNMTLNIDLALEDNLWLPHTSSITKGVIFKGGDPFMHNYQGPSSQGENTFLGRKAGSFLLLGANIQSSSNTGIGSNALSSIAYGFHNTALGSYSLSSTRDATHNTALGAFCLHNDVAGSSNTAVGSSSMRNNLDGNFNTAVGTQSMYTNTGNENTALGYLSLYYNGTGSSNTAVGNMSLNSNSTGSYNTGLGNRSLYAATGNFNTAVGHNAGSTITDGHNLTCLGVDAAPTTDAARDQITLGNIYVTTLRCNATTITSLSDSRDKKNIRDLPLGLNFISKLKPRLFNWDKREWYKNNVSDGSKMKASPTAGFIAQELDQAQKKQHAEWLNLVLKDNPEKIEATPGNLLPIMVKAIQELKIDNEALRSELDLLRKAMAEEVRKEVRTALQRAATQADDKLPRFSLSLKQ